MEYSTTSLKEIGCTYFDIGEALIHVLIMESEPLEDFIIDYRARPGGKLGIETMLYWFQIEDTPEFRQILKIAQTFVLECKQSRHIKIGTEFHLSLTITEFIMEVFKRYHKSINQKI